MERNRMATGRGDGAFSYFIIIFFFVNIQNLKLQKNTKKEKKE